MRYNNSLKYYSCINQYRKPIAFYNKGLFGMTQSLNVFNSKVPINKGNILLLYIYIYIFCNKKIISINYFSNYRITCLKQTKIDLPLIDLLLLYSDV